MESPPEGGADNLSKKRAAFRQLTKDDDPDAEEETNSVTGTGTFKRASDAVLASRRIVKVRRAAPPAPTINPFASISLVPPFGLTQKLESPSAATDNEVPCAADTKDSLPGRIDGETNGKEDVLIPENLKSQATDSVEAEENGGVREGEGSKDKSTGEPQPTSKVEDATTNGETVVSQPGVNGVSGSVEINSRAELSTGKGEGSTDAFSSFSQHSTSKNAFSGTFGTGFRSSSFSFGVTPSPFLSPVGFGSFGSSSSLNSVPSWSSRTTAGGTPPFFKASSDTVTPVHLFASQDEPPKPENFGQHVQATISLTEVPVETGEEKEKTVFTADATLFEFIDKAWKERGKGELKINLPEDAECKARLVMRSKGNLRLLLNANLFPDMRLNRMDGKSITFACANSASTVNIGGLTTYAVKLRDSSQLDNFIAVVEAHKCSSLDRNIQKVSCGTPNMDESSKKEAKDSKVRPVEAVNECGSNV